MARQVQAEKPSSLDHYYYQLLDLRGNDAGHPMATELREQAEGYSSGRERSKLRRK